MQLKPCLSICPRLIWHMPNSKALVAALSSQSGQEEEKAPEGQEVKDIYLPSFLSWNFKVLTFGRYFSIYFHFTSTVLVFFSSKNFLCINLTHQLNSQAFQEVGKAFWVCLYLIHYIHIMYMYVLPKLSIAHSLESFMFESILPLKPLKCLWLIGISTPFSS